MGIPYSKQINSAFDQVTPLVAEGFEVLQTTRNISVLLACIQVLTALLQLCTLCALIAILISINPDLKAERQALITPVLRHFASWVMPGSEGRWILKVTGWTLFSVWLLVCGAAAYYYSRDRDDYGMPPIFSTTNPSVAIEVEAGTGKDVDAVKSGQTDQ